MAYEIKWYVEGQVLYIRYWGEQTEDDLVSSTHQIIEMVRSSSYEFVHRIVDVSDLITPLPLVKTIKILRDHKPAYMPGWLLTVGERTPVIKFIFSGARLVSNQQMRSIPNFEAAIEFLKQADPTIRWNSAESG